MYIEIGTWEEDHPVAANWGACTARLYVQAAPCWLVFVKEALDLRCPNDKKKTGTFVVMSSYRVLMVTKSFVPAGPLAGA